MLDRWMTQAPSKYQTPKKETLTQVALLKAQLPRGKINPFIRKRTKGIL